MVIDTGIHGSQPLLQNDKHTPPSLQHAVVTSQTPLPSLKRLHYNKSRPAKQITREDPRDGKSSNNW